MSSTERLDLIEALIRALECSHTNADVKDVTNEVLQDLISGVNT